MLICEFITEQEPITSQVNSFPCYALDTGVAFGRSVRMPLRAQQPLMSVRIKEKRNLAMRWNRERFFSQLSKCVIERTLFRSLFTSGHTFITAADSVLCPPSIRTSPLITAYIWARWKHSLSYEAAFECPYESVIKGVVRISDQSSFIYNWAN